MRMPLFLKYPGILASSIVPATLFFRLFSVFLFLCMREGSIRERKQEGRKLGLLDAREGSSVRVAPHQKRLLSVDIYTQASHQGVRVFGGFECT